MNGRGIVAVLIVAVSVPWVHAQNKGAAARKYTRGEVQSAREMQKLYETLIGTWQVTERFEIGAEQQGKARQGSASFRAAPGNTLIEEYRSTGSAGSLSFLALLWWDQHAQNYRLLTCANNRGCQMRGTARWEGKELVNSWKEDVGGKSARFKDSFMDLSPPSFRLVSEGTVDSKTIWRVITSYKRMAQGNLR